jgi:hypothetical protein
VTCFHASLFTLPSSHFNLHCLFFILAVLFIRSRISIVSAPSLPHSVIARSKVPILALKPR